MDLIQKLKRTKVSTPNQTHPPANKEDRAELPQEAMVQPNEKGTNFEA